MDLETLREPLGDKFEPLKEYVSTLEGQRDQARQESISGRKTLKSENESLKQQNIDLLEKLGIESFDELESLPDAKGQADAVKQLETKNKRLETDLADKQSQIETMLKQQRDDAFQRELSDAIGDRFVDSEIVGQAMRSSVEFDGETPFIRRGDKLMPVKDAVDALAADKPQLVKSSGAGGSGYRGNDREGGSAHGGDLSKMSREEKLDHFRSKSGE